MAAVLTPNLKASQPIASSSSTLIEDAATSLMSTRLGIKSSAAKAFASISCGGHRRKRNKLHVNGSSGKFSVFKIFQSLPKGRVIEMVPQQWPGCETGLDLPDEPLSPISERERLIGVLREFGKNCTLTIWQ